MAVGRTAWWSRAETSSHTTISASSVSTGVGVTAQRQRRVEHRDRAVFSDTETLQLVEDGVDPVALDIELHEVAQRLSERVRLHGHVERGGSLLEVLDDAPTPRLGHDDPHVQQVRHRRPPCWHRTPRQTHAMAIVSFPRRLADLAAAAPDRPAVTCGDVSLTRAELESHANRLARDLAARGVGHGDFVTVALPNSVDWFVAFVACWKLGAVPQPVSAKLPARELTEIVDLAQSKVDPRGAPGELEGTVCLPAGYRPPDDLDDGPLPDATSPAWKAPTSGGSTGRPKLIVSGDPAELDPGAPPLRLMALDGCLVMPGPLYHNGPGGVVVPGAARREPRGRAAPLRRRGDARRHRALPRRHGLRRPHDDEADLAAARGGPSRVRRVVAARRLAPRRALPDVAQGGVDRVARGREDLRAVRRNRGPGGDRHHRARVARAPRLRRPAGRRGVHDRGPRRQPVAARRAG